LKQKLIIALALILLLAVIGYMARDLFFGDPGPEKNPFDFGMEQLRESDSSLVCFEEVTSFSPGLAEIHGRSRRQDLCGRLGRRGTV
jgi:hypothetical protein